MAYFQVAFPAPAINACTGGAADVHMVAAMTIFGQNKIHMTKLIRGNLQGCYGATGISLVSRHTGAGEEYFVL